MSVGKDSANVVASVDTVNSSRDSITKATFSEKDSANARNSVDTAGLRSDSISDVRSPGGDSGKVQAAKADSAGTRRGSVKNSAAAALMMPKPSLTADSVHRLQDSTVKVVKTVVIQGKSGQALAQSKQQNSDNLKNVIDAELIAKLPDQTTADALQRVPGLSVQRDNGEGTYVMIRGTEPRLSTVTVNGQSMAGTDADTRAIGLNIIPSDQLAEIEVAKVLMPEMDANAIGGTVNLITSTAKDSVLRIKANFTPGYMQMSGKPIWEGSLSGGKRFFNNALGIFAGGSYEQ